MALFSKCGGCGATSFEIKTFEPRGGRYKLNFVQCASCGVPVSTEGYFDTGSQIETMKEKVESLERRIRNIEMLVANIDQNIAKLGHLVQR